MGDDEYYMEERSCFLAQCKCLCSTGACRCCCRWCPSVRESTSTRLVYVFFLLVFIVVMAAMMAGEVQDFIMNTLPDDFKLCEHCDDIIGYMAVYRLGLAIATYHILLMLVSLGVKSSKDCRASIHNGLWIYKIMIMVGLSIAVFYIPDPQEYFIKSWMYIAMVGAALFLVIQLILLVFMIHRWTDRIVKKVNNGSSPCYWYGIVVCGTTVLSYSACVAVDLFLYYFFAWESGCYRNQWFIGINCSACAVISLVAACKRSTTRLYIRLFQTSLICLYVHYLTWMAISSAPRRFQTFVSAPITGGGRFSNRYTSTAYESHHCGPSHGEMQWLDAVLPYISVAIMFCTVVYASVGTSNSENCHNLEFPDCPTRSAGLSTSAATADEDEINTEDIGGQKVIRNEKFRLSYSYSLFHVMMALAALFMMMSLTEWYAPTTARLSTFGRTWSAAWIKIVSSWACLLIYLLCMVFPALIPKRYRKSLEVARDTMTRNGNRRDSFYGDDNNSRGVGRGYFGSNGSLGVGERLRRYSAQFGGSVYSSHHSSLDAVPLAPSKKATIISNHQETTV